MTLQQLKEEAIKKFEHRFSMGGILNREGIKAFLLQSIERAYEEGRKVSEENEEPFTGEVAVVWGEPLKKVFKTPKL